MKRCCNSQLYLVPTLKIETNSSGRSDQRPSRSAPIFLSLSVSDSIREGALTADGRDAAGRDDMKFRWKFLTSTATVFIEHSI